MIKDRNGGRYMRCRNHCGRYYLDRHSRFNFLHGKFKGKLSFENWDKKEKEDWKQVRRIIEDLWMDTYGITGKEVTTIAEEIDDIFHKEGYTISHDKINHFVVDVIRKK